MNTLDAGVTILGLVEMLFTSSSALVAFRAVRFFRLFRLMRYMKSLQKIVQVIASSFMSILYASLLLLLFSFIFTIFGMQVSASRLYRYIPCKSFSQFDLLPPISPWSRDALFGMQVRTCLLSILLHYPDLSARPSLPPLSLSLRT